MLLVGDCGGRKEGGLGEGDRGGGGDINIFIWKCVPSSSLSLPLPPVLVAGLGYRKEERAGTTGNEKRGET